MSLIKVLTGSHVTILADNYLWERSYEVCNMNFRLPPHGTTYNDKIGSTWLFHTVFCPVGAKHSRFFY